ncbi:MAG TPA: two-component regulator propeller domain-containing protein [Blastocatellia bacterium]|nr:two-component regulator propeller domain-containing protein [Blastocatellia bacterium]
MPNSSVQAVVQSRDGYLWLGTQEGLVRFDGARFVVFDRRNTAEISQSNVQSLTEGRDGSLWIGTIGGLVRLKDGKFTAVEIDGAGTTNTYVRSLLVDRQGQLWIGLYGAGLRRYKDGKFTRYSTQDGLASDFVTGLAEDHAGNIWVGTLNGLDSLKDGKLTHYTTQEGLPHDQICAVREARDQSLWIGTLNGLARLKDGKFTTYNKREGLSHKIVLALCEDAEGSLWIGTEGGGMNRFKDGKFTTFSSREGLSNDSIWTIYQDFEGTIWIGTFGGGLNRLRNDKFITYTTRDGLVNDVALPIYSARDGSTWIGTINGMSRLKNGKFTNYTVRDGLPDPKVLAFAEDPAGNLWIGTNGGLCRFQNGRFTVYNTKNGLLHDSVRALYVDREGRLWVGTRIGLARFNDGKFINFANYGFPSDFVHIILEDRAGQLWVGSNKGLSLLKDGKFTTYTTRDGLPMDMVYALHDDTDGTLWIGTSGGGLSRFKQGRFTNYSFKDGLFNDSVFQILEDDRGNFWMTSNKGISRVSKQELNDFADGKIQRLTSVYFGTSDGLKTSECNGSAQPAGCRTNDGRLWFPTMKGVSVIDPNAIKADRRPPLVNIESIVADDRKAILTGKSGVINFPSDTPRLEINYNGISLSAPEKVCFRYRLEGFDRDWIDAGSRRVAYYTNLPPGDYRFKVMAGNTDGVWNENIASYDFYLAPHFYQRYWFYLLCALLVGGIAGTIYRVRVRQMQERFSAVLNERNRIAREMHDTLIQGVVGASALLGAVSKTMTNSPQQASTYLEMASLELNKSLDEVRVAVGSLREPTSDVNSLPDAIKSLIRRMIAGTTINGQCLVQGKPQQLIETVAENLLQISREAIANAVQHAAANRITVELQFDAHFVELRISDDGTGFNVESPATDGSLHFGLLGMRERAVVIGGDLTLDSQPGTGTQIRVRVSLNGGSKHAALTEQIRAPWLRLWR